MSFLYSFVVYMLAVVDQLPRLGKRELICLILFTCNYVVSFRRGFLFLWVLEMGYIILFGHSLSLPIIILDISHIEHRVKALRFGTKFGNLG